MSGFWYTAAIATTASTLLVLGVSLGVSPGNDPSKRAALEQLTAKLIAAGQVPPSQNRPAPLTAINQRSSQVLSQASDQAANLASARREEKAAQRTVVRKNTDRTNFEQAVAIARGAVDAYHAAQKAETPAENIAFTRQEKQLWRRSIQKLSAIPRDATLYPQANDKKAHYTTLLATAERKILDADSSFLSKIVSDAQLPPEPIHITLCQIDVPPESIGASGIEAKGGFNPDHCRHHQGEQLLASPASLIKLPIAIALLDKVSTEKLDLNSQLYIDPDNFTENAIGATIEVDQEYPLVQVMDRMIDESNNIATNQLIDYVGRESIAQTLAKQGYRDTFVDHKLAGDRILPPNPGTQSNRITTDDITTMMVNTYRLSRPGDDELLEALLSQKDQELGYQAIQELKSEISREAAASGEVASGEVASEEVASEVDEPIASKEVVSEVEWLGEKTGQNNRMLGTTLAIKVDGRRYALTVAIDYGGDPLAIRNLIQGVTRYLIENGPIATESQSDINQTGAQGIVKRAT